VVCITNGKNDYRRKFREKGEVIQSGTASNYCNVWGHDTALLIGK
jgi:hypothetical protein